MISWLMSTNTSEPYSILYCMGSKSISSDPVCDVVFSLVLLLLSVVVAAVVRVFPPPPPPPLCHSTILH